MNRHSLLNGERKFQSLILLQQKPGTCQSEFNDFLKCLFPHNAVELLSEITAAMERALPSETEKMAAQVIQITLIAGLPIHAHFIISKIEKAPYNLFVK